MEKPTVELIGQDGNVFNLLGICSKALRRAGQTDKAQEMSQKVMSCGSYDEALQIMMEYVEIE